MIIKNAFKSFNSYVKPSLDKSAARTQFITRVG